jgi:integrase
VSPDEFQALLGNITDRSFADLLIVSYETGCRPQESLRVEARHVELDHARWVFPPQEAKGKSMPRVVYLSHHAVEICKQLVKKWHTGPLFRNAKENSWNKDSVGCAFDRLQIKMGKAILKETGEVLDDIAVTDFARTLKPQKLVRGIMVPKSEADLLCEARCKLLQRRARQVGPRCSLYALRHSWATNALQRGVDALTVAVLMGHKDPSTLARTYQHLSHNPEHLLAQARKASA